MQAVGASFSRTPELNAFLSQTGYQGVTRANFLSASSRRSTDISLVTAEGDKVTITAKSALQAEAVSYNYRGRLNGNEANLQGKSLQASSESSLVISVEGDLDKEEVADIKKLVAKLEKLGADSFSQPLEDSLLQTLGFDDLDSLASFAAHLRYEQQFTAAQVVKAEGEAPVDSTLAFDRFDSSPFSAESVWSFIKKLLDEMKDAQHLHPQEVRQGPRPLTEQTPTAAA